MERATQNLENDHQHILKLIEVMEEMVKQTEPNISHLEEVVELIRKFADGLHHTKEEQLLFPLMAEKGFSQQQGPVAVMLMDHEQGRAFVKGMADNILRFKDGQVSALILIYSNMLDYAELLINHIAKENNILFRMADQAFTLEDQARLVLEFSRVDSGSIEELSANAFIRRIETLVQQYLPIN